MKYSSSLARISKYADPRSKLERAFSRLGERNCETLLVFSVGDPALEIFREHLGAADALAPIDGLEIEVIHDADHVSRPPARARFSDDYWPRWSSRPGANHQTCPWKPRRRSKVSRSGRSKTPSLRNTSAFLVSTSARRRRAHLFAPEVEFNFRRIYRQLDSTFEQPFTTNFACEGHASSTKRSAMDVRRPIAAPIFSVSRMNHELWL